jgi:hypothetical protein
MWLLYLALRCSQYYVELGICISRERGQPHKVGGAEERVAVEGLARCRWVLADSGWPTGRWRVAASPAVNRGVPAPPAGGQ